MSRLVTCRWFVRSTFESFDVLVLLGNELIDSRPSTYAQWFSGELRGMTKSCHLLLHHHPRNQSKRPLCAKSWPSARREHSRGKIGK